MFSLFSKPEPEYKIGEFLFYNKNCEFDCEEVELVQIHGKNYMVCTRDLVKSWHYDCNTLKLIDIEINNKNISKMPYAKSLAINISEKSLKRLEEILALKDISHL